MTRSLEGVYAALITPFNDDGTLALDQLQTHMSHIERKGCNGVLVCGTTGEAMSLTLEERIALLDAACHAGTSLKVLAGTGAASLEDAVRLTRAAFNSGAAAVVVLPPFFYRETPAEGLFLFYESLITRAVPADGKFLLYHNPVTTITAFSFELIARLCDRFPDIIVGIKDSSGDIEHSRHLNAEFPHLQVLVGDDRHLSANLEASGAGAITGLANIFPDMLSDIYKKFTAGESTTAAQERMTESHGRFNGLPRLAAFKALLAAGRVINSAHVRPPLRPMTAEEMVLMTERFHLDQSMPESIDLADLVRPVSGQ